MKCISSPALNDIDIARFVDGEAEEEVAAHMVKCSFCRERARHWTFIQKQLRRQLYRAACPTPMELGDYGLGLLSDPQKLVVAQHLRLCSFCRQEVAILEEFLEEPGREPGLLEGVNLLVARLISGQAGFAEALRGDSEGPLTFEANGIVIVLDIRHIDSGHASLMGQIAAEDQDLWMDTPVELHRKNQVRTSTRLDDLGAFHYQNVLPGQYELWIGPRKGATIVIMFEVPI
jgi:hypothetical protein